MVSRAWVESFLGFGAHARHLSGRGACLLERAAALLVLSTALLAGCGTGQAAPEDPGHTLLVVAYDPARALVAEASRLFVEEEAARGVRVTVRESIGGSGKQARAVADGLEADVVVLGLESDVTPLTEAGLVRADWKARNGGVAAPFTSTVVLVVREGNPKHIQDWGDLARADVAPVAPNPKTSSAAKLAYLSAWGWALSQPEGSEATAEALVRALYTHAVVLDATARAATTTFSRHGIGDVLVTWENEAYLARAESKRERLEVVLPSRSIVAEPALAVVDENVDRHGTRALAERYVRLFASASMQEAAARAHFRPRDGHERADLRGTSLFRVDDVFGSMANARAKHFTSGAVLDRILEARR